MKFKLKQYDKTLLHFEYIDNGIGGQYCKILSINEAKRNLLPHGLDPTDDGIMTWLKRHILPKNRAYSDTILAKNGLSHQDTIGIIQVCKGLSVTDCYWVVAENSEDLFCDYNLYDNDFDKVLSVIAYTGYGSVRAKGFTSSPEFTTNGMLKKAWRRRDNSVYLYKGGTSGAANTGKEPYSEFYAAQIAEKMGIPHIDYGLSMWKRNLCSTCEIFTSKEISYVQIYDFVKSKPLQEVAEYLRSLGDDFYDAFVDMIVFDAVICNTDRHYGNFGLLVANETNEIVGFAPLFDHGLSLFNYAMDDEMERLDVYAETRISSYNVPFVELAKAFITEKQKVRLRHLIGFQFTKHSRYNLKAKRLRRIEQFIQKRVIELLELDVNGR